ncbi:MAG: hypothetical protein ACJA00_004703 [Myxococcota bacterium]|jgi:hypothetical protein
MSRLVSSSLLLMAVACNPSLEVSFDGEEAGLLGITGTSASDVWVVGADAGDGPSVMHFNGQDWIRKATGTQGDLWWAHALDSNRVLMAGANATVLMYDGQTDSFERIPTPGPGRLTVFGLWASAEDDIWAVGGHAGRNGFVWHYDGAEWEEMRLPLDIERVSSGELPSMLKVWGDGEGAVWVVGDRGTTLRSESGGPLTLVPTPTTARLFTVTGDSERVIAVGEDGGSGVVLSFNEVDDSWTDVTPGRTRLLQGVALDTQGNAVAVGAAGEIIRERNRKWRALQSANVPSGGSLHAVWVDPEDGVWSVGGNILTAALDQGVLVTDLKDVPTPPTLPPGPGDGPVVCPAEGVDFSGDASVAHAWNEQVLNAIRRDIPEPGVHARNLLHSSVAMWDAWVAYDDIGVGVVVQESATSTDVTDAREIAMSYAAHEVLTHRYARATGGDVSLACFDAQMTALGLDPANENSSGADPVALGNRIGKAVIARFAGDGANEANDYADPNGYEPVNSLLTIDSVEFSPEFPDFWAPINLAAAVTQNGIAADSGVQDYIGPHWGSVEPFALERPGPDQLYFEGSLPAYDSPQMDEWLIDVLRKTAWLDTSNDAVVDVSPGAIGNSPLGTNSGAGYAVNPSTGQAYAPNPVLRADFGRVLAEFWADGPKSETPPGHWNTLANDAVAHQDFDRLLFGETPVDALEWDAKMYLALNGAVHDAAIAAWELKRVSESARPVALIRYRGGQGQSTDTSLPNYSVEGLPLVPGLVEVITDTSSLPGERHDGLQHFVGQVAVYTWRGEPGDSMTEAGGHGWVRAVEWMPYQRRTFVSPAFPGYVSGHSTFSRAAAVALEELTGDAYFPGGLATFSAVQDEYLVFEQGPSTSITLQWATYADAADQAGQSRLWGGIHVEPDDLDGRVIGAVVGELAVEKARQYFDGTVAPSAR